MRTALAVLVAILLIATTILTGWTGTNRAAALDRSPGTCRSGARLTVVLVHGAWADTGSWSEVVRRLEAHGYSVRVFPTPLRSLAGDTTALRDYLSAIRGPVVLVGHSYGGAVVTDAATGNTAVHALVYLDAFAPAAGQRVFDLPGPDSALAATDPATVFDAVPASGAATVDLYVRRDVFIRAVANDLPRPLARVLAATQRPVTLQALMEFSTAPAWASIPSWYEVGTVDRVIPPTVQLSMARAAGSHVVRVRSGHLPMISTPGSVTTTIERAACATS